MLGFAILPAVALAVADGVRRYGDAVDEARSAFMSDAIVEAQGARDALVRLESAVSTLSLNPEIARFGLGCDAVLESFETGWPMILRVVATDMSGLVRCASDEDARGVDMAASPSFRSFSERPAFGLGVSARGVISGREVVYAIAPLRIEGDIRGMLAMSMPVTQVRFFMGPGGDGGIARRRAVIDYNGDVLVEAAGGTRTTAWLPAPDGAGAVLDARERVFPATSRDGRSMLYATAPLIRGESWLVAAAPDDLVVERALWRTVLPISAPFMMLVIAVFVAYFALDRLVIRHLIHLARITRIYGSGKLDLRPAVGEGAPQEIASLAADLGSMAGSLAERQAALRRSAEQNRILLLEVYHRVKNSLQMIVSLLALQTRRAETDIEREALERIGGRVHSMALVHEKLYEAKDLNAVDLGALLRDIAVHVVSARALDGPGSSRLRAALDDVSETPERATPVAMFVNEAMVNAVKHGGRDAPIDLSLRRDGAGGYVVEIANAAGRPSDPSAAGGALGSRIMSGFARQLRAETSSGLMGDRYVVTLAVGAPPRGRVGAAHGPTQTAGADPARNVFPGRQDQSAAETPRQGDSVQRRS